MLIFDFKNVYEEEIFKASSFHEVGSSFDGEGGHSNSFLPVD